MEALELLIFRQAHDAQDGCHGARADCEDGTVDQDLN
jgi:hypothetical protein